MDVMLVGGMTKMVDRQTKPLLQQYGLEVVEQVDWDTKSIGGIPKRVQGVVILRDVVSHTLSGSVQKLAREQGLPVVCITRKRRQAEQMLQRFWSQHINKRGGPAEAEQMDHSKLPQQLRTALDRPPPPQIREFLMNFLRQNNGKFYQMPKMHIMLRDRFGQSVNGVHFGAIQEEFLQNREIEQGKTKTSQPAQAQTGAPSKQPRTSVKPAKVDSNGVLVLERERERERLKALPWTRTTRNTPSQETVAATESQPTTVPLQDSKDVEVLLDTVSNLERIVNDRESQIKSLTTQVSHLEMESRRMSERVAHLERIVTESSSNKPSTQALTQPVVSGSLDLMQVLSQLRDAGYRITPV